MTESSSIKNAKNIIQSVKGKMLSVAERKDRSAELTALILEEARRIQTFKERRHQAQLARMMRDPSGKAFTTAITDACFRSRKPARVADQMNFMIQKYGVPQYLSLGKRLAFYFFKFIGKPLASLIVPLTIYMLRNETEHVILPGEENSLKSHLKQRRKEKVRVNLNHLGEAILGEEEAQRRLNIYLHDLAKPEIEYISVKISTIYSQINLLAWDDTLNTLAIRLRQLYRAAMQNKYVRPDGSKVSKFVNLDMEEYRDLNLTVALFKMVLNEPEFHQCSAGIVLQSYLPDSFLIQQDLTAWAMQRLAQGGAPIKIRIVKGANLAMEQVEGSLKEWPQAPYTTKAEVDANFKRMINYGCQKDHALAAHIGIGSHNLFDIAYGLLLRSEKGVEDQVSFEMLEGMADHMRRVVQQLSGDMLLYCPVATKEEFQNAVAYLIRRLDENTAPENFLHDSFSISPGTSEWNSQSQLFSKSCLSAESISSMPRRSQNRNTESFEFKEKACFCNEPDTDWSLPQNKKWVDKIVGDWKKKVFSTIPLVINGEVIVSKGSQIAQGEDPSHPGRLLYHYSLATSEQVDSALKCADQAKKKWASSTVHVRAELLGRIAQGLRRNRSELIGAMIADTGKTIPEADVEVSEAIDFAEYYRTNLLEWASLPDIQWSAKGTVLVASPWNFPCSIPAGGILAALAAGNCVLFKPAPEAVLVGWELVKIFWEAGIDQKILQFITCVDEPVGSQLIKDSRIAAVILTGATATAKLFMRLRPNLDLVAETGGKNVMVITSMSDRDLAIKDLIHSAFGHSGQKCSACSLAILEGEVYDDLHFRNQLRDAAASLLVGPAWDLKTKINPLINIPNPTLMQGLTTLEEGEEWLLKPVKDPQHPNLWSPGIKLGVKPGSFTFQTELFGPVLGLVRAKDFNHAAELMNQTAYGLTAGIHSLDEREQRAWLRRVEAGNCYINRTMTGAIVQRQPFGGCKESSFGRGAKAGGPNYLTQLMDAEQVSLPIEQEQENDILMNLKKILIKESILTDKEALWDASIKSYSFYWNHFFSKKSDPSLVVGQDNFQSYVHHPKVTFRVQKGESPFDIMRVVAAAMICKTHLDITTDDESILNLLARINLPGRVIVIHESEGDFIRRVNSGKVKRVRLLKDPSIEMREALAQAACKLNIRPVLANGRLELLHYLREVSISRDYHRYGNLGDRENEIRNRQSGPAMSSNDCGACCCHGK